MYRATPPTFTKSFSGTVAQPSVDPVAVVISAAVGGSDGGSLADGVEVGSLSILRRLAIIAEQFVNRQDVSLQKLLEFVVRYIMQVHIFELQEK